MGHVFLNHNPKRQSGIPVKHFPRMIRLQRLWERRQWYSDGKNNK